MFHLDTSSMTPPIPCGERSHKRVALRKRSVNAAAGGDATGPERFAVKCRYDFFRAYRAHGLD